jgi:tetratricopeptide (TPR) repeat protein
MFYIVLYVIIAAIISFLVAFFTKKDKVQFFLLLFILQIFLPIISWLFLPIVIYYILLPQKNYSFFEMDALEDIFVNEKFIKTNLGESGIYNLNNRTILFLKNQHNPLAINMLEKAIGSNNDEFTMIAFTSLKKIEEELFSSINEARKIENDYMRYSKLAKSYWELYYLKLEGEDILNYFLTECEKYTKLALEINPNDNYLLFLLGRIYLTRKDYTKAREFFYKSLENSVFPQMVLPYLIEVLYYQRDFKAIEMLSKKYPIDSLKASDIKTYSILKVWL